MSTNNENEVAFVRASTEIQEPAEGDVLGALGINGTLFLGQLVNFLVVLVVLWIFAYKPLMKLMDERSKKIEQGIKRADEMEARVVELESERERVMKEARREANATVVQAQMQAKEKMDALLLHAKEDVARMTDASREQMRHEKDQLVQEARGELAVLVVEAATRVVGDALDTKKAERSALLAIEQAVKSL
ncbi:MAG: F0F1 ATP synthase subunit B [Patescibacteria group bacterium]